MAKKSITTQIHTINQRLATLDQESKRIQEEKRQLRQELKTLNDQRVAELGRQLLSKLDLDESDNDSLEVAFKELDNISLKAQGGQSHDSF